MINQCVLEKHVTSRHCWKRPIPGSKIESAYLLFNNEFLLFQFRFKPKISSRKLFTPDSSKIRPKISPRKKTVQKSLSQHTITKKLHSVEEESLLLYGYNSTRALIGC